MSNNQSELKEFTADGVDGKAVVPDPVQTGDDKRSADKTGGETTTPRLTKTEMISKMVSLVHGVKHGDLSKAYTSVVKALSGPTDGVTHVTNEEVELELDEAADHEAAYEKAMDKHHSAIESGRDQAAEMHALKAEKHAEQHFKKTGKKIKDAGYTGRSAYIVSEAVDVSTVINEDLTQLFEGTELTEQAQTQISALFMAAVNAKAATVIAEAQDAAEAQLAEAISEMEAANLALIEGYINRAADSFVEENRVVLEHNIRTDIAESFMKALHGVFNEHWINIPEEKVDVVEQLTLKIEALEAKNAETLAESKNLAAELSKAKAREVFAEETAGLTDTQADKMRTLSEGFDVTDPDAYRSKLHVLRESSFVKDGKKTSAAVQLNEEVVLDEAKSNKPTSADPEVAAVLSAMSRIKPR